MLHVDLDHIFSEPDAMSRFEEIFTHVTEANEIYLITRGGNPGVAVLSLSQLEDLQKAAGQSPASEIPTVTSMPTTLPLMPEPLADVPGITSVLPPLVDQSLPELPSLPPLSDMSVAPNVPAMDSQSPSTNPPANTAPESAAPPTNPSTTPATNSVPLTSNFHTPEVPEADLNSSSPLA